MPSLRSLRRIALELEWKLARAVRIEKDRRKLGFTTALQLVRARFDRKGTGLLALQLPDVAHPLWIRIGTSDHLVVHQVFTICQYEHFVCARADVRYIVDCGANIGCTAVALLHMFPNAKVLAIEPDPENFALLERNTAPYGDRVQAVRAAVWSEERNLTLASHTLGRGDEWGRRVHAAGGGSVAGRTLSALLAQSGFPHIDILKVDIEGAEKDVFTRNHAWLDLTRHLVIELHGQGCDRVVTAALSGYRHDRTLFGELTYFSNLSRLSAS